MNNFEIDDKAKEMAVGNSAYKLARKVIELEERLKEAMTDNNKIRGRMHDQWINQNKNKYDSVREAFMDGAECFGVSRDTVLVAWETSDSKLKLERGES